MTVKKTSITKKMYYFKEPLLRTCFQLVIGRRHEEFEKSFGEDPNKEEYVTKGKAQTNWVRGGCVVWMSPTINGDERRANILHELIHVCNGWLKDRGIDNEETLAYLYEFYVKALIEKKLL